MMDKILRANLFNSAVLPAMLYAGEMCATTKKEDQRLDATQRAMERLVQRISLHVHIWSV